ncbi:phage holin family protein [Patescibacteria group bacterium]|nr:phage holin family protein [Patescibacteria group bacterium]MBU4141277.1 phage holin family protein [Patescibacteria group bacterium]MBU4338703.1 phage holin family protein [Patescibacteria group bacterium]MBU4580519.1 phage holin family protein [Patescibacteria group bacterium]
MRFIYQILINAIAIKAAAYFKLIPGFEFTGDAISLLWVSFLLTIVNFFLKPILKLLFGPLILLTLGLFTIVINMIILYIVDYYTQELAIANMEALFWATVLLGFANLIYSLIYKK